MTIQTPDDRDASATPDTLEVKSAGEGARKTLNPFEAMLLPTFERQEEYDAIGESPQPVEPIEIPSAPTIGSSGLKVGAGAWGGYKNGQIPTSVLKAISFAPGQQAEAGAAAAFEAMNAAYRAATGRNIGVTDSYRSLAGQYAVKKKKPRLAATPGTSNHGWGKAFDLNVRGDARLKAWLDANAARFGFVNPAWAKKSKSYEPWHWEFVGGGSGGAAPARPKASPAAQKLVNRAKQFVGTPFKWGGTGPLGFDQSGFTQYLYREMGVNLPRVSYQQASFGQRVGINALRPGDLVAWDSSKLTSGADHVAIYIGNGQVIHAPRPGDRVKISPLWDTDRAWGVRMNL